MKCHQSIVISTRLKRIIRTIEILEDCYQRKSVIVTSQLPVAKWYDYINEPTLAAC